MKGHPYLRAYMAGVLLPSWFLLLALGAFLAGHITQQAPARLESAIVFPMAIVPNLGGCGTCCIRRSSCTGVSRLAPLARCSRWSWFRLVSLWHPCWT
jgi:hypothetical protein